MAIFLIGAYASSGASATEESSLSSSPQKGAYTLGLTLGYTPSGDEGQIMGKEGIMHKWVRADMKYEIVVDGSFRFSKQLLTQLEAQVFRNSREYAIYGGQIPKVEKAISTSWSAKGEVRYRLYLRDFDPEVYISARYPWSVGAGIGYSIVNDPIIFQGTLEYNAGLKLPDVHITASGKVGFIVNESVSLVCVASHARALGELKVPETTISFGASYLVGSKALTKVSVLAANEAIGNHNKVGFLINLQREGGNS